MNGQPRYSDGSPAFIGVACAILVGFCILAALLSAMGMPAGGVVFLFVVLVFVVVVLRSVKVPGEEDTLTGKGIFLARQNGMALSIEWLSAFGLFGISGALFALGLDALAFIPGLLAGFVLSAVLIAPRLGRLDIRSLPDYLEQRYGGYGLRWITLAVIGVVTLLFVAAQLLACGLIAEQSLGLPRWTGVLAAIAGILLMALPGGIRSLTSAQTALAAMVISGLLIAALWLLCSKTGIFVPHLAWGGLLADIEAAEKRLGLEAVFGTSFASLSGGEMALMILCLALGSAAMPSLIFRASASIDAMQIRAGLARGALLFAVVATVLPALAVLAYAELLGLFTQGQGVIAEPPAWMLGSGTQICGTEAFAASGVPEACAAQGLQSGFSIAQLSVDGSRMLLALPELTQAPVWTLGLLAMAGLSAALIAGGGALLCFAEAVTSRASPIDAEPQQRFALLIAAASVAVFALVSGGTILGFGGLALAYAGACLFMPLVLGLWWPRANGVGALIGIIGGAVVTSLYLLIAGWGEGSSVTMPFTAGALGIVVSMLLTVCVSLATKPPAAQEVVLHEDASE